MNLVGTMLYGTIFSDIEDGSGPRNRELGRKHPPHRSEVWATYGAPTVQVRLGGDASGMFGSARCTPGIQNLSAPCDPSFAGQDRRVIGASSPR